MKITYDIKKDDVWSYGRHITFNMKSFRRKFIFNIAVVPISVIVIGLFEKLNLKSVLLYGAGFTVVYVFVLYSVLKFKFVKNNAGKNGPLGRHSLELGLKSIKEIYGSHEISHPWAEIIKVEDLKKHIYLYWDSTSAFLIPKSAFKSGEEQERFMSTVKNFMQKKEKSE